MSNLNPDDFLVLYPGVLTEREKTLGEKYLADNKALEKRGEINAKALVKGELPKKTPGLGPKYVATEAMIRYCNEKYDPENSVLNDAAYAKKLGYKNIIAMPAFGANDDTYMVPFPPDARDTMCVSQLNHSITYYKPIYPKDTLYLVSNKRTVTDVAPSEGSIYRSLILKSEGSIYNQKGEKVNDVVFRVMESLKIYKPGKKPAKMKTFFDMWEAPAWKTRPAHYYTDQDWDFIKSLWAKEKRQGAAPLYWEDVKIGDQPAWTVDGPIMATPAPTRPYGMGVGGSRTLKKEIMDPAIFKTMVRDKKTGIYLMPDKKDYIPPAPDGADKPPADMPPMDPDFFKNPDDDPNETREVMINFQGRDIAIRHINNWMGDHGWLYNIRWGIMPSEAHAALGKIVPKNPDAEYFLGKIPSMKGKHALAHGLTTDLAIVKSCVYNKYVRNGEYIVELGWWIESIVGEIWHEGGATVKLPSKRMK